VQTKFEEKNIFFVSNRIHHRVGEWMCYSPISDEFCAE